MFNSIKEGQEVDNVVAFKKAGVAVSLVSTILSFLAIKFAPELPIDPTLIMEVSSTIVTAAMGFLTWVQLATTKRIGI
jgi:hypothetical protein